MILLMIMPLITMRSFSEEKRNKTLSLLISSPLSMTEIVLGKFLGLFLFVLILVSLLMLMPLSLYLGTALDTGKLVSIYLSMLLLLGSFAAIGLYLSSLTDNQTWFTMNCYHQCFLYDCLQDVVEDYSYNDEAERRELFPEMEGRALDFNRFLLEYFFNTTFLIAPERFNSMIPEERERLLRSPDFGQDFPQLKRFSDPEDPTLAKVINRIPPGPEEMTLKVLEQNPYTF